MHSARPISDKRDPQDLRPRIQRPGATGLMGRFRAASLAVRTAGVAVLLLLTALAAVFAFSTPAHAQEGDNDYVDVGLTLIVPEDTSAGAVHDLGVVVVNHGSRTAYDVEVVLEIKYPDNSVYWVNRTDQSEPPEVPVGSASLESNGRLLRWSIPALGGLQRVQVVVLARHLDDDGLPPPDFDNALIPHEHFGTVTTSSFESERHKGNNTSRVWAFMNNVYNSHYFQVMGNYTVVVSVDNPSPSPGDTVNFTITTGRDRPYNPGAIFSRPAPAIDLKVDIELTDGPSVTGTPTYPSLHCEITLTCHSSEDNKDKPDSVNYSNGVFNVGTLNVEEAVVNAVTLPVEVASSADVNGQCLTATLTGNPPPGTARNDDDISDNVAKLCLSVAGTVAGTQEEPFMSGQVDTFTIYPCVDVTGPPCDSTDDIRVRAVNPSTGQHLGPGTALLQINPTTARIYDGHENSSSELQSVNDGNTVSWQTSVTTGRPYKGGAKIWHRALLLQTSVRRSRT